MSEAWQVKKTFGEASLNAELKWEWPARLAKSNNTMELT